MPKESLRDKLDGNELDLSLSDLTTVPVNEIAALAKVRSIDLSCNLLVTLPRELCTLSNIVKLDLSKNNLRELPDNIGSLQKLQQLDLYKNHITTLPLGTGYLKNLKWLDLKDNPLEEPLKSIAGDCLDETQCRKCATKVYREKHQGIVYSEIVAFFKNAQSEKERQRQKQLQMEREEEARKKAEEELENQRKRHQKKQEKERRRKEYEAQRERERQKMKEEQQQETESTDDDSSSEEAAAEPVKPPTGLGCCGVFLAMFSGILAIFIGLYFFCQNNRSDQFCRDVTKLVQENSKLIIDTSSKYFNLAQEALVRYVDLLADMVNEATKSGQKTS